MNTLSAGEESVSFNGSWNCESLNKTYHYGADVFLYFRVLIQILERSFDPNQSRDSDILFTLKTLAKRE